MRQDIFQQTPFLVTCDSCPPSNFPFATCQSRGVSQLEQKKSMAFSWVWKTMASILFRDGEDGPCCSHNTVASSFIHSRFSSAERFRHVKFKDVKRNISRNEKSQNWMHKIVWEAAAGRKQAWGPKRVFKHQPLSIYLLHLSPLGPQCHSMSTLVIEYSNNPNMINNYVNNGERYLKLSGGLPCKYPIYA